MRTINKLYEDACFRGFMNSVLQKVVSWKVYNTTTLQSYPKYLSPQEENVRKILARHEDQGIYGGICNELDEKFEKELSESYIQLEQDRENERKRITEENQKIKDITRGRAAIKRNPIQSFQAIFTGEIAKILSDDQLIVYAFIFYTKSRELSKKAKSFYTNLLDITIIEFKKRDFPTDGKEIQKLYNNIPETVRKEISRTMKL